MFVLNTRNYKLALSFAILGVSATAIASNQVDLSSLPGDKQIKFAIPNSSRSEVCIIPKHNALGKYKKSDLGTEEDLCAIDFYLPQALEKSATDTETHIASVICPKDKSTSAGTIVFELPQGKTQSEVYSSGYCKGARDLDHIATYKQTDNFKSCTYTPANLGYYHVSRILGGAGDIRPMVLRTMDLAQHSQRITQVAVKAGYHGLLGQGWVNMSNDEAHPKASDNFRNLFTTDATQIYGALITSKGHEDSLKEWDAHKDNLTGIQAFSDMSFAGSIGGLLGHTFDAGIAQRFMFAHDMADNLVMDYLFAQGDRFSGGNFSSTTELLYLTHDGKVTKTSQKKYDESIKSGDLRESDVAGRFLVKRSVLRDTDCGLVNGNAANQVRSRGYVKSIRHLDPDTYTGLQRLYHAWTTDGGATKTYFKNELRFSDNDLTIFGTNLQALATQFKTDCDAGKLFPDLDYEAHMARSNLPAHSKELCATKF